MYIHVHVYIILYIHIVYSLIIEASANYTKKDVGGLGQALAANVLWGKVDVLLYS